MHSKRSKRENRPQCVWAGRFGHTRPSFTAFGQAHFSPWQEEGQPKVLLSQDSGTMFSKGMLWAAWVAVAKALMLDMQIPRATLDLQRD